MIAIAGGLGAAVAWALTTLAAARASRMIGAPVTLAWVMLTGFVVVGPITLAQGRPDALGLPEIGWLAVGGLGNIAGLLLVYPAFRIGKIGVVSPITSSEGAVTAVIAVAAGEHLGGGTAAALAVVVVGIVLAARPAVEPEIEHGDPRAALLAMVAACLFGTSLYATGRVSERLPLVWAVLPPRLVGVLLVTIPFIALGRMRVTRAALPYVVVAGLAEVAGFYSYAIGARHGIAVSAVLASQFAALAALAARVVFGERLSRSATFGVIVIAAGVAAVSALRA